MTKIAIFASGSGSNAENIVKFFDKNTQIVVKNIFCNVKNAFVLERAKKLNIPTYVFNREEFNNPNKILKQLVDDKIDFIVQAGFLWLMPKFIVDEYPNKIINIHPALLPKFGGKGMFGENVHKAVIEAKEKVSGITIHYVNSNYDEGNIIFQAKCNIDSTDTAEDLAAKIHVLEQKHFPTVIKNIIEKQ